MGAVCQSSPIWVEMGWIVYLSLSFLDRTCPDDCTNSSQGICDTSTGICDCKPGFVEQNCAGNVKHSLHTCKTHSKLTN